MPCEDRIPNFARLPFKISKMKVAVWDTYVTKKDESVMHFDIIVPEDIKDTAVIYGYGKDYLKNKGQDGQVLNSKNVSFATLNTLDPNGKLKLNKKGILSLKLKIVTK